MERQNLDIKNAVKVFEAHGYYKARTSGSHMIFKNDKEGMPNITISLGRKRLSREVASNLEKHTGISLKNRPKQSKSLKDEQSVKMIKAIDRSEVTNEFFAYLKNQTSY